MDENHQVYLNKRQCGGGYLMVWDMILSTGHVFVKTVSGRINSDTYIKLMKDTVIPLMRNILPQSFVLQRDNWSSRFKKKFGLFWGDGNWAFTLAQQEPGPQQYRKRVEHVEFKGLWWSATEKQTKTGRKSFWSRRPHELASFWIC